MDITYLLYQSDWAPSHLNFIKPSDAVNDTRPLSDLEMFYLVQRIFNHAAKDTVKTQKEMVY